MKSHAGGAALGWCGRFHSSAGASDSDGWETVVNMGVGIEAVVLMMYQASGHDALLYDKVLHATPGRESRTPSGHR